MPENGRKHLIEPQCLGLLLQLARELLFLAIEPKEDLCLALEDVRLDGLIEEVHGAAFVSLEEAVLITRGGRHENDRNLTCALTAAHEFGEFEAVHPRHLHVEEGERNIVH